MIAKGAGNKHVFAGGVPAHGSGHFAPTSHPNPRSGSQGYEPHLQRSTGPSLFTNQLINESISLLAVGGTTGRGGLNIRAYSSICFGYGQSEDLLTSLDRRFRVLLSFSHSHILTLSHSHILTSSYHRSGIGG